MTSDLNGYVEHMLRNRGLLLNLESSLAALWLCLAGLLFPDVHSDIKPE